MPETLPQLPRATAPKSARRRNVPIRSRVRNSWRGLAALSALALVLAACSSSSAAGVTVGNKTVDESTLKSELSAIAKNPQLKSRAVIKGKLDPSVAASWLTALVETQVAQQAVQQAGTKITKADKAQAQTWADGYFGTAAAFAAFPKSFRQTALTRYASVPAYVRTHTKPPTDAAVQAAYNESLTRNCASRRYVSHILVASQAAAQAAVAELNAGTDFAQEASKVSTDTQSAARGGALGCIDGQQVDSTFAAAANATPVGQVSAPVQTQYGWHIIKVQDVEVALPFAKVRSEIKSDLVEQGPEGQKKLIALMGKAKVTVTPKYGRWVVKDGRGRVEPPTSSTSTTTVPKSSSPTTATTKP